VDWYETAHALCGGDDFGEFLPWAHALKRLVDQGRTKILIRMTDETMEIVQ
jgi:hypothetical protein